MPNRSTQLRKRGLPLLIVFAFTLSLIVSTVATAPANAAPRPGGVINTWSPPASRSIYNVPKGIGMPSAQVTIYMDELIRAFGATPKGETIYLSTFLTSYKPVIRSLIAAHKRGVNVQFITWNKDYRENKKSVDSLKKVLGDKIKAPSFLKICKKSCLSNSGTQHAKLVLISRFINDKGKTKQYAIFVASGNISTENVVNSWNHAQLIVGRKKLYNGFKSYFDLMKLDRTRKNIKPVTDGAYTAYFYPVSTQFNPFFSALEHTSCKAKKGHGLNGRTVVRVIMYLWRKNTSYDIVKRLTELEKQGCDVGVIVSQYPTDAKIVKALVISGTVNGKSVEMVVTGSLNFTRSSMVDCTDIALRMYGKTWVTQASSFFDDIASHSRKV